MLNTQTNKKKLRECKRKRANERKTAGVDRSKTNTDEFRLSAKLAAAVECVREREKSEYKATSIIFTGGMKCYAGKKDVHEVPQNE